MNDIKTISNDNFKWLNGWVFDYELSGCGFEPLAVTWTSDIPPVSSKEFLDIQATIACGFIVKHVQSDIYFFLSTINVI